MALQPIQYGPDVQADDSGIAAAHQALAQQRTVLGAAHDLGAQIEGGAAQLTQGILHTQALKATAQVKTVQADTLKFIDENPYVSKDVLKQRMAPEDYEAWHAKLAPEHQEEDTVPMYTAAGDLFDSEAKKARADASQTISLPGWRGDWDATERTESATIRERYVNRLAADQMISDQRSQQLMAIDQMVDSAVRPEDFDVAMKAAETSQWLKPAERRFIMEKVGVAKDSFAADNYMRSHDIAGMEKELRNLRSDSATDLFPHMTPKQRLELSSRLEREYNFYGAKDVADKVIVGPHVDEDGKVDRAAIAKAMREYAGPNKPEVLKAVKQQEAEALDIFNAGMADLQQKVWTAGQNPKTGEFSMARAQQNGEAREAAMKLNKNAPGLLTALGNLDVRRQRIEDMNDREARQEAKRKEVEQSQDNLREIYKLIDDPTQSEHLRGLTPQQFHSQLLEVDPPLRKADMDAAKTYFDQFQKRGGKPDQRPAQIVGAELMASVNGDRAKYAKASAKYGDTLLEQAHDFIRQNSTLPPDKLTDATRKFVRGMMLKGDVLGSGYVFNNTTTILDWQTNPKYVGMDMKLPDGTVIDHGQQRVKLSKAGETRWVLASDAEEAHRDGWE